jgi:hypothetical protein
MYDVDYGLGFSVQFALSLSMVLLLPQLVAVLLLFKTSWISFLFLCPVVFHVLVSTHIHVYLHSRDEDAPLCIKWFLRSSYGRALKVHHYLHHKHVQCNYNFFYLGADWIRRTHRDASNEEMADMLRIGLID